MYLDDKDFFNKVLFCGSGVSWFLGIFGCLGSFLVVWGVCGGFFQLFLSGFGSLRCGGFLW